MGERILPSTGVCVKEVEDSEPLIPQEGELARKCPRPCAGKDGRVPDATLGGLSDFATL